MTQPGDGIALLVIDMQVGLFGSDSPRYDVDGTVRRINALAAAVRGVGGTVVFVQHDGPPGDTFAPGSEGWRLLSSLDRQAGDPVVHKRACDAFYETDLAATLRARGATRLLVTGCATDFCVDTTIRAAASRDYDVVVVEDGHTTADRPHVDALSVMRHHNWVWQNLIHPKTRIEVVPTSALVAKLESAPRQAVRATG
jgi:nicotinamidase-related amidase